MVTRTKSRRTSGPWRVVGTTAAAKVLVMGLSGLLAIVTSRLIIQNFGVDAFAQYGLLSTLPSLLPFADLGIAAAVINAIATSTSPQTDDVVRRTLTSAFRILICSGLVIISASALITVLGWWPTILGGGLLEQDGPRAAFVCMVVFGLALPLGVGQRVLTGLGRTPAQIAAQAVVAPFMLASVSALVALGVPAGGYLSVLSYLAAALVSLICLVMAARSMGPALATVIRDIPRIRAVRGVSVMGVARPMLIQMMALPIAMQTDRLLLSHLTQGDELAQYNFGAQLFGMITQTISAAGLALWPIFARARSGRSLQSPYRPLLVFVAGGLALAGVLAALTPWLSRLISDGQIALDVWTVGGFVAFVGVQAAKYPLGMYMTDLAGLRFQVVPILLMVPFNLVLSWWLIGVVGAGGPIIGSAVAVMLGQVLPNLYYVRRDLRRRRAEGAASASPAQEVSG